MIYKSPELRATQAVDYEAAGEDTYEADSFCVADDESLVEEHDTSDALDDFEETEETMRICAAATADRRTRLKGANKRSG